jgi:excisionase family DNA binding protein
MGNTTVPKSAEDYEILVGDIGKWRHDVPEVPVNHNSSGHRDSSHVGDVETRLLTPQEVATRLGVSERWVRDHATRRTPRIPAVKLGPLLRFRLSDIEDFLMANRVSAPSKSRLAGV